ncbi:hypothetical protein [Nocardia sp. NBC_00511]|uniref:WXG100-like domain-containing protein n=1 Tax=Nocardia sp. NBC_00511 TaxID=2903591 RepID=UPI0030E30606
MSPTGTIDVVAEAFNSAATNCANAHKTVTELVTTLAKTLDDNWGCAGTDNTGHSFANSYDPAAFNAVASGSDIANGLGKLYDLLKYTSINHANGNTSAATDPNLANLIPAPLPIPAYATPTFRGSYGGDSDAPLGWGLITRWLQGRMWPNGHQDGLDNLSSAWSKAKDGLNSVIQELRDARGFVGQQVSDEIPQILAQIDLVIGDITNLANHCEVLSTACWDYSKALTQAHHDIEKAMLEFGLTVGGVAILSSIIGPEGTAGGGALAAGLRGEATAARVITIVDALADAVTAKNVALAGTALAAGRLTANLQPLLDSTPTRFNADTPPGNGGDGLKPPSRPSHVPDDWIARKADNGKGWVWQKPGSSGNANIFRDADPNARYPNGYVRFYNDQGQPIKLDGKPGSNAETHIPKNPDGTYPTPQGW